jgi:hypothetical protein
LATPLTSAIGLLIALAFSYTATTLGSCNAMQSDRLRLSLQDRRRRWRRLHGLFGATSVSDRCE